MQPDDVIRIKKAFLDELTWPTSAGAVQGAAERMGEPDAAAAASRLDDQATWLDIDTLMADLDPHLKEISHNS